MVKSKGWLLLTAGLMALAGTSSGAPSVRITSEDSGLRVSWTADSNRTYRVESFSALNSPPTTITNFISADTNASVFVLPEGTSSFYRVIKEADVDGSLVLTNGQVLSGYVDIGYRTYATGSIQMAYVVLVDVLPDDTFKILASETAVGLTNGTLRYNTAESESGEHHLELRVQEADRDPDIYGPYEASERVTVYFDNPLIFTESPRESGWALHYEIKPYVAQGTWQILINRPDGSLFKSGSGLIQSSTNSEGVIVIEDAIINDNGVNRYRNPGDEYPQPYFDVYFIVTPALPAGIAAKIPDPGTYTNKFTNYVRTAVAHRPGIRLGVVAEQPGIIPIDGTRSLFQVMMDTYWAGFGQYMQQTKLDNLTRVDPLPFGEAWNMLSTTSWSNLNVLLANRLTPGPTAMFTFTHGGVLGLGIRAYPSDTVSAATLASLGYTGGTSTNGPVTGLTFCFPDACMVGAGDLIPLLLVHHSTGEISRSKLIKNRMFQHFGCGWKKIKTVALRNGVDIIGYHGEFVGWFGAKTVEIDPVMGWAANTYRQADSYAYSHTAIYLLTHWDFTFFGCPDGYFDE